MILLRILGVVYFVYFLNILPGPSEVVDSVYFGNFPVPRNLQSVVSSLLLFYAQEINFEAESIASTVKAEPPPNVHDLRFTSKESTSLERDIADLSELPPERPLASSYGMSG